MPEASSSLPSFPVPSRFPPTDINSMRLHNLVNRPGARTRSKRVGHGESSGLGRTSGRGGKGQSARSGSSQRLGFEGGQMPLIRRIPKRGFNNARHRVEYLAVNVGSLSGFEAGTEVTEQLLKDTGVARGRFERIKILADGDLDRRLVVHAHGFSKAARAKIEAAGGECHLIARAAKAAKVKA